MEVNLSYIIKNYQLKCFYSQFFVGDDILVAPVLDSGSDLIDVKFPKGTNPWRWIESNQYKVPKRHQSLTLDWILLMSSSQKVPVLDGESNLINVMFPKGTSPWRWIGSNQCKGTSPWRWIESNQVPKRFQPALHCRSGLIDVKFPKGTNPLRWIGSYQVNQDKIPKRYQPM